MPAATYASRDGQAPEPRDSGSASQRDTLDAVLALATDELVRDANALELCNILYASMKLSQSGPAIGTLSG
jgi:hypothetical protein